MMSKNLNRLMATFAVAGTLICGSAMADTLINNFNNFNLSAPFGVWADTNVTTLMSGPDSYRVESQTYGSGYYDINPNINAGGEDTLELDVTVNSPSIEQGVGVLVSLVDEDITFENFGWFGLQQGNHVLTMSAIRPGLNLADLSFFHLQVDPGGPPGQTTPYDISFNNLRLVRAVPEPASVALLTSGLIGMLVIARRRSR